MQLFGQLQNKRKLKQRCCYAFKRLRCSCGYANCTFARF